jgi:hypothetical protein
MKPDQSSVDNIRLFLSSIQDAEYRSLLENHLNDILVIGADQDADRNHRKAFFQAVQDLVEKRLRSER